MTRKAMVFVALILLAGCSNPPVRVARVQPLVVNPSPLAHLTYDCSVLASESSVDATGPLFYFEPYDDGSSEKTRMCAVDWQGHLRRELERSLAVRQSPDGSRLLVIDYPILNGGAAPYLLIDDQNHVLGQTSAVWQDQAIWADDSRHLCYITDSNGGRGGRATLELLLPGSAPRAVATLGFTTYIPRASTGGPAPTPFTAGPRLLACSVRANRAVILDPEQGTAVVVRLPDGAQLMRHVFGHQFYPYGNQTSNETLMASVDGHYLADNVDKATSVPIIDLLTDRTVTTLPARSIAGFSWDDTLAVVQTKDRAAAVLDWHTGRVIRRLAADYAWSIPRPDSEDVLMGVPSTRHQFGYDLYVVRADGSAFEVARSVEVVS